jgi:hypothetical protein
MMIQRELTSMRASTKELGNVTNGLLDADQSIISLLNKTIDRVTALEQGNVPDLDLTGIYDQLEQINDRLQHQGDTIAVLTRLSDQVTMLKEKTDPMIAILQGVTEINKKLENRIAVLEGREANVTREELDQFKAWIVQQFEGGE